MLFLRNALTWFSTLYRSESLSKVLILLPKSKNMKIRIVKPIHTSNLVNPLYNPSRIEDILI